jgi:hypothetical protein
MTVEIPKVCEAEFPSTVLLPRFQGLCEAVYSQDNAFDAWQLSTALVACRDEYVEVRTRWMSALF